MSRDEIFEKAAEIAREVFELEELDISDATTADDIEEWDSLTHMSLISDIEGKFHVTFTLDELRNPRNFGSLVDTLMRHIESGR